MPVPKVPCGSYMTVVYILFSIYNIYIELNY